MVKPPVSDLTMTQEQFTPETMLQSLNFGIFSKSPFFTVELSDSPKNTVLSFLFHFLSETQTNKPPSQDPRSPGFSPRPHFFRSQTLPACAKNL